MENNFRHLWANNADGLSILYTGTPALKTEFTRYGRITYMGKLKDGITSVKRYFINCYFDYERQNVHDFFFGVIDTET